MEQTRLALGMAAALSLYGCGAAPQITVKAYPSTPDAVQALKAGEVEAVVGDMPVMAYTARESAGTLEASDGQFDVGTFGIAIPHHANALKKVLSRSLAQLMTDGEYMAVLRNWALPLGRLTSTTAPVMSSGEASAPQLEDGVLKVGMDIAFAPMEFYDEQREPAGLDVELAKALGGKLGVEVEFVHMPFDRLLDAVSTGEVDVAMSAITVNDERAKKVDFIDYLQIGSGVLSRKSEPVRATRPDGLCGRTVGVQSGTVQQAKLETFPCE